jgi:hypothetical protein
MHKLVLAIYARNAKDDGSSTFPSIETVAALIGRSTKQTRRLVHRLVRDGWMQSVGVRTGGRKSATASGKPRGNSVEYQIRLDKLPQTLPFTGAFNDGKPSHPRPELSHTRRDCHPPASANPPRNVPEALPPAGAESINESINESVTESAGPKSVDIAPLLKEIMKKATGKPEPKRMTREEQLAYVDRETAKKRGKSQ